MTYAQLIVTFLSGGAAAAIVAALAGRGVNRANAAKAITEGATTLVEGIGERLDDLQDEVDGLRAEVASLRHELRAEERRSWAAIGYVRQLLDVVRRLDPAHPVPGPPEILRDLI